MDLVATILRTNVHGVRIQFYASSQESGEDLEAAQRQKIAKRLISKIKGRGVPAPKSGLHKGFQQKTGSTNSLLHCCHFCKSLTHRVIHAACLRWSMTGCARS
jgi:hypothetical protein